MTQDIFTVMWKEWKEVIRQRSTRGGFMNWAILVLLIGVIIPLQFGPEFVRTPGILLMWSWPPILGVIWLVADSIAGERERRTLETLLASRLPDQAILLGKVLFAILYGFSIEVSALILALVTVNVRYPQELVLYDPAWAALTLLLSLTALAFVSTLGVVVSLRSNSVRSAYQKLGLAFLVLALAPTLILPNLPEPARIWLAGALETASTPGFALAVATGLAIVAGVLLAAALARFQRAKLILD